jgi:hypothetical protein
MPSLFSAVLGLMTALSLTVPGVLATFANKSSHAWDVTSTLKTDPDGYLHIADDGVARAYDANDTVTGYIALSNDQLMQLIADLPGPWQNETDHLHSVFDSVDGRQVVNQTQLLDPPDSLRRPRRRGGAQSRNDKRRVESLLERSTPSCAGLPCYSSSSCQFQGCSTCAFMDYILPSEQGICLI